MIYKGGGLMQTVAVIMAGGQGRRFWPVSRKNKPKQFLSLTGDGETMLQSTVARLDGIVRPDNIYVVTNIGYVDMVNKQLPMIPYSNIICEPIGRNTAPCIGLVLNVLMKKYEDAVMIVLPSDHVVKNTGMFKETLSGLVSTAARTDGLFTIGIRPNYPETGYGYIKYIAGTRGDGIYKVERFVEKPDEKRALEYLRDGNYLWNSGMFVWKMSVLYGEYKKYADDILKKVDEYFASETSARDEIFAAIRAVSVDVAILEKSELIYTVVGDFGWDDAGSFAALQRVGMTDDNNNYLEGNVVAENCSNCVVKAGDRLVAVSGMENVIIVDTADAVLVCAKNSPDAMKSLTDTMAAKNMERYL